MQVAITCRHGSLRDDIRGYLTQKSEKLLTYFERVTAIQVTVDFLKDHVRTEILVDTEHRHDFVANAEAEDVVASFDGALHKVEQQIKKYKQRIQDHRRDLPLGQIAEPPPPREPLDGAPPSRRPGASGRVEAEDAG